MASLIASLPLPLLMLCALVAPAAAHDVRPGALALREIAPGTWAIRITPAQDGGGVPVSLRPVVPVGCSLVGSRVECGDTPLSWLELSDLAEQRVKVVVHAQPLVGAAREVILFEGEALANLAATQATADGVALRYLRIGVEHIIFGPDHLLFVLGLALVGRSPRRVAVAVSGFTLSHSVTLAATTLGWARAPSEATELIIAGSILLLAADIARDSDSLTSRAPVAVSLLFGLVHGFGFAGALGELGLPAGHTLTALLCFNAGVELGQLAILTAAFGVAAVRPWLSPRNGAGDRARRATAWAMGVVAGYWTVARFAAWVAVVAGSA